MKRFLHPVTVCALVTTLAFLLSVIGAFGQTTSKYTFDHLTPDEGLSQSTVFAIAKDAQGFMWFGTRDGLNRYDSRTIKVFRNHPNDSTSLSGNSIQCLFTDQDNKLWIGTSEGISIYNPVYDNFTQSKPRPEITERLSANHVTAIARDADGEIWVATYMGLNKVVSQDPLTYQHFIHDELNSTSLLNNEVRSLYLDREGALWVGTSLGVSRMTKSKDGQTTFINYKLPSRQLKRTSWINCLSEDDQGNLLIGTEYDGVKLLDRKSSAITSLNIDQVAGRPIETVRVIQRNGPHEYWLGTIDGLFIYDEKRKAVTTLRNDPEDNTTMADNSVRSIFIDPSGSSWVGTFYGGVNCYSPLARQFGEVLITNSRNQKGYKVASAMVTDAHNNLWIGTDGNGLYTLDSNGKMVRQYKHDVHDRSSLSHNKIKSLLLEDNGLWIGTLGGLNFLDFATGKMKHYFNEEGNRASIPDDRVYDIKKDSHGTIWIATYRGGLCRFNKKDQTFERYTHSATDKTSLSSDGVTFIHEDSEKNLWIGTIGGLNKMTSGSNFFEHFSDNAEHSQSTGDYVLCIFEDRQKNIWVGTRDNGLKVKFAGTNKLTPFTHDVGLAGNNVSGIQEDSKGNLWISTDNGLARLNPRNMTLRNYNKDDGLACKEFNFNSFHKDRYGMLYFGGYNGIVKFHPDSIRENTAAPNVSFTRLRIFNKEVMIDPTGSGVLEKNLSYLPSLTFNYRQNVFSIEFAGLSFVNAEKNQYAYKLEGFEDQWNYVNDPVATYMNLQPGDYTLLAKASNNDGLWTSQPIRLNIEVLPPPWKTWWAYVIYATIILGLVLALIKLNNMRWKFSHDLKIKEIEAEQQEKLHLAKLNFFTNVAHEIRTPLTLIVTPIELVEEQYAKDDFIQRQLRIVKANTSRLMRLINQLLDFQKQEAGNFKLRMQSGNLVELLKEIVFSFTEYAHSRHVNLSFSTNAQKIDLLFDRDELEKVFFNLLHNAFKFTPGGGSISICVSTELIPNAESAATPFARIVVEDNGIGIPSKDVPKIFNRFFQVEQHNTSESGFGIGLALTRGIIQLHGGSIQVESREADVDHAGMTRFTILLPLTAKEWPARSPETVVSHQQDVALQSEDESQNGAKAGHPLVLVVDDNTDIRLCLIEILQPYYEVIEAADGKEAWGITIDKLPDLIISDIAMNEMDGLEFTELVKNDERTNHIPLVLLTARGSTEHHVEGIESGADDYITKPFHAQILLGKIKNLISSRERLKAKYNRLMALEPAVEEVEDPEDKFVLKLRDILEANLTDPDFNVSKLVKEIGMSRSVLFRKIKVLTGLSVIDLIRTTRLKKAEKLLKQKKMNISEVAFTVGFNDPKYFSKSFRSQFGKTPTEYMESL